MKITYSVQQVVDALLSCKQSHRNCQVVLNKSIYKIVLRQDVSLQPVIVPKPKTLFWIECMALGT